MEAGHRVLWYAGRQFVPHIRRVGAVPVPFRRARDYAEGGFAPYVARGMLDGLGVVRRLYHEVLVGQAEAQLRDLTDCLGDQPADVLLSDTLMLGAGLVADRHELPWTTIGDGPLLWRDADTPPFGTGLRPLPGSNGRRRNRTVQRAIDRWLFAAPLADYNARRADLGLAPAEHLQAAAVSPHLHLQGCSPSFEYPRAWLPDHIRFVGALGPGPGFAPPLPDALRRGRRERPLAFVTQGTLRTDVRELALPAARALTAEGFDVLVAAGRGGAAAAEALNRAGPGSMTVVDLVDYHTALAEADLFVTNGGYTGVTLALAAGVPVLQAGATEEKPDIGARLEWAGVGHSIRGTRPSVRRLRLAARQLMESPGRAEASRRLAREMAQYDARVLGARLLADLVAARAA